MATHDERPLLLFFTTRTSGPARRMASMIATLETRERSRVRVLEVDAERDRRLAARLGVTRIPSLVLVRGRSVLGRIEGRASATDVSRLLDADLAP